jgi:hypothetical protein
VGRVLNHLENFPSHWVIMSRTEPRKGRAVCIHPTHPDSVLVLFEWDLTEQIRKDFNADHGTRRTKRPQ